ncbi:phage holin [Mycolicibacterium sp. XJ1819]
MLQKITSPKARLYLYTVATAGLAVLVGYGIVEADKVPLWLGFLAALGALGNGTAAVAVHQQRRTGTLPE